MSQKQIYELEGVVSMEDKNALKKIGRLIKLSDNLRQKLKVEGGIGKPTQEYQQLCKIVDTTKERVSALRKEQEKLRQKHTNTAEYKQLQKDIANAESELDKMIEEQISLGDLPHGARFNELEEDIERAHKRLEGMKAALSDMEVGATDEEAQKWFMVDDALRAAENDLKGYTATKQSLEAKGWQYEASNIQMVARKLQELKQARQASGQNFFGKKDWNATPISRGLLQVRDRILAIASATNPARATIKRFLDGAVNDTKSFVGWLGRLRSGFGSVFQRLKKFPGLQTVVGKRFGFIAKHANKMKRGLMMGAGIKGLVRLGAAGAVALYSIRMMKEGMANLIKYDTQTAGSVNQLKASLLTLKNALATAFAPVLNVVAPILNHLIGWLVSAATAVAHFMAALTGQSQVVIAKKIDGTSSAFSGAASSANDANNAAQEYQRTLMGFDQINKLDDPTSGSGSGGSGSGGGGGLSPSDMFTTTTIDSTMANWADKIKEAWAKADFTEIGAAVAEKLNNALANIPWDKIRNTCDKIAKSIGTFINGFVEKFDWGLLAKTISYAIETAIDTVTTLIQTIHWQSIGKAIVDFITGIDYGGLMKSAAGFAGSVLGAASALVDGIVGAIGDRIKNYFSDKIKEHGGNIVAGILAGIVDAIKSIGSWIQNNLLKPFIDGFKKAFGINSPSKVMSEQGGYMISGLLEGLTGKLGDVLAWAAELPKKIMEKIGTITVSVVGKLGDIAGDLKGKAVDMVANFISWTQGFKTDTISGWIAEFSAKAKKKGVAFIETVSGWVAEFSSKAKEKGKIVGETISGWTAKFSSRLYKAGTETISGWKAKFTTFANGIKKTSRVLSGFKAKITSFADSIKKGAKKLKGFFAGKASGGIYKNGRWAPVQTAAVGGSFNQGQMFIAREAGPELVGTIGGNTAVMNNDQIVASVAAGVAQAVASVMGSNSNEVNVYLQGDAGTFFRVMQSKAIDYTRATGQPAFPV